MTLISAAIANGGTLMKPYLVDHTENYTGTTVKKNVPETYETLMTSEEAAKLKEYMEGVIDHGTGTALSGESYTVAGKQGQQNTAVIKKNPIRGLQGLPM